MASKLSVRAPALLGLAMLSVAACGPSQTGSTYTPADLQRGGVVQAGRIISVEDLSVSGSSSGVGTVAGGLAGGLLAGSLVRGQTSSVLAGIGGAILGSLAGNAIEQGMTRGKGTRFHVQLDSGPVINVVQTNEENFQTGDRVTVLEGGGKTRLAREGGSPATPPPQ